MTMSQGSASEVKVVTNVVSEDALREAQLRALKIFADAVSCTYGPMGGYTAYSLRDTNSNLKAVMHNYTKDGFTVLKHVDVDKPIESLIKDEIRDICTQVIKKVGDGTTSATMMSYYLFQRLYDIHRNAGAPKRAIIRTFKDIIKKGRELIIKSGRQATVDDIYNIALTSLNGNEEMAEIIKKIYEDSGMDVFIDVAISNTTDTVVKTFNGMTYESGYIDPAFVNNPVDQTCELINPKVYVFESPIDTPDMINNVRMILDQETFGPVSEMQKAMQAKKEYKGPRPRAVVIISPHISRDANSYIDSLISQFTSVPVENRFPICLVTNIANDNNYLTDIMNMTGAKFIKKYIDPKAYENDKVVNLAPTDKNITTFGGEAEKVVIDALSTRIINPKNMFDKDGNRTEFFANYLEQLDVLLKKYEETREELVKIGNLKRRINVLKANMVELYIGGIGIADRDSLKDSVEDAVLNCRSAAKEGVGYAANYEGLKAFNRIDQETFEVKAAIEDKEDATDAEKYNSTLQYTISSAILRSYVELCSAIYLPYYDGNKELATKTVLASLTFDPTQYNLKEQCPLNIITETFDGKVLTSIQTEPVMLDAIARIITLLFDTNQFIVPDPRFNVYSMDAVSEGYQNSPETMVVDATKKKEEKPESVPVEEFLKEEDKKEE